MFLPSEVSIGVCLVQVDSIDYYRGEVHSMEKILQDLGRESHLTFSPW